MPDRATITPISEQSPSNQPEKPRETGHKRLEGESVLWFNRYCLYRDLGHKRSLRAAVAKERESLRLLKEPPKAPESTGKAKRTGKKAGTPAPPPAPEIQVPGSWKAASKTFRWSERAKAFDAWLLERMAAMTYEHLGDTHANAYKRVQLLDTLITFTMEQFQNAINNQTTHKNYLAYVKQIAALMAQMEREMNRLPEEAMKAAITAYGKGIQDEIEQAYHAGQTRVIKKL